MELIKYISPLISSFNWPEYSTEDLKEKGKVTEDESYENGYRTKTVKCEGDGFFYTKTVTEYVPRKEDKLKKISEHRKVLEEEMKKLEDLERRVMDEKIGEPTGELKDA